MHKYFFLLLLSLACASQAETVKAGCGVYDKVYGTVLFSVSRGTVVQCGPSSKGWCAVQLEAFIRKRSMYEGLKVLANAPLRSNRGQLLGYANMDFTPLETIAENDTAYVVRLGGFMQVNCIEDTSIVEHELERIFAATDTLPGEAAFSKHFKDFNYEPWVHKGSFHAYLLRDVAIEKANPGVRAAVIFEGNQAVAVVYGRTVRIKKFEMHLDAPNYKLYVLKPGNEAYKNRLADAYMKALDALY